MKILIRLDGNSETGLGHLIRGITIANTIKSLYNNIEIIFFIQDDEISKDLLEYNNYQYFLKKQNSSEEDFITKIINEINANILIIDKLYPYAPEFIQKIKRKIPILMLHNLCAGAFYTNIFILPSGHTEQSIIDDKRWKNGIVKFYDGIKYVVINESIKKVKQIRICKNLKKLKIVISTGGSDPKGVLITLLNWMREIRTDNLEIIILVGRAFLHKEKLKKIQQSLVPNFKFVPYCSEELINANIAISTFGITTYELLYLGIPTISIGHTINNAIGSRNLQKRYEAIIDLGLIDNLTEESFLFSLYDLINNENKRRRLKEISLKLIDGNGARRIADLLYKFAV